MFRCFTVTVAVLFATPGQSTAAVEIWLSSTTTPAASLFPTTSAAVEFAPRTGTSQTFYIWGRPDFEESLINLSLNVVAQTQPCTPTMCVTPVAISFTGATVYNPSFGGVRRFEYVDVPPTVSGTVASTCSDDLATDRISANLVCGIEGVRVFPNTTPPAVGIRSGAPMDPYYSPVNDGWLIGAINYTVPATSAYTETHLYLEIGPIGMTYEDESSETVNVVIGHMDDEDMNAYDERGMHLGSYDAVISPWRLQGDFDGNGIVGPPDETFWRTNFGSTSLLAADHSGNSVVDADDYVVWRKFLGASAGPGGANAVPEPSAGVSMFIAFLAFLRIRGTDFSPSVRRARTKVRAT